MKKTKKKSVAKRKTNLSNMRPNEKNEEKECGHWPNEKNPKQYAAERKKRIKRMWPNEKNETICSQTKKTKKKNCPKAF